MIAVIRFLDGLLHVVAGLVYGNANAENSMYEQKKDIQSISAAEVAITTTQ